ncbi:MAG: RNA 2',3'-cyclic phosphodiesterase [bacterium]|nr:RNA 2',3'-cyclic phosphodiesterase [bacterium]
MKRTFIAISLSTEIKEKISKFEKDFQKIAGFKGRLISPEKIHLTLKFLGPTLEEKIPQIISELMVVESKTSPFQIEVKGVGAFPNLYHPNVLWVDIPIIPEQLERLQQFIEVKVETYGFAKDHRKFKPHLTISRIKTGKLLKPEIDFFNENKDLDFGVMTVTGFTFLESILRPEGAEYLSLGEFKFNSLNNE